MKFFLRKDAQSFCLNYPNELEILLYISMCKVVGWDKSELIFRALSTFPIALQREKFVFLLFVFMCCVCEADVADHRCGSQ